jgi:hypothetical protein
MKFNEVIDLIKEDIQPGMERLVSYVENILGKRVSRPAVRKYIKDLKKDKAFINRISKKAKAVGNEGYIWSAVRGRTLEHFKKELNPKKD